MDKPSIVLSGSAVFHGAVNLHFHSHVQPTRKREDRNNDNPMSKMMGIEHSSESDLFVCSEKPEEHVEAIPEYPVHSTSAKDFYLNHIGNEAYYQIIHRSKGLVLLLNNEFRDEQGWREGSAKDVADMEELWRKMGCRVITKKDLNTRDMVTAVESVVSRIKEVDFFVAIIMSHGGKDDFIIGADRREMQVKQIVDAIARSDRLRGRPKLIFFQMCRGQNVERDNIDAAPFRDYRQDSTDHIHMKEGEHGAEKRNYVDSGPERSHNGQDRLFYEEYSTWVKQLINDILKEGRILGSDIDESDALASEYTFDLPDVMLAFASQPEHVAFLNRRRGSWFIQSLKRVFTAFAATDDVVAMMEKVKDEMSKEVSYNPGTSVHEGRASVDGSNTFGRKRLFLFPGFP